LRPFLPIHVLSGDGESEETLDRKKKEVRRRVAERYGQIATARGGCCESPTPGKALTLPVGYDCAETVGLPADATVNSYGCGNPVTVSDLQPGDVVLDLGCGAGLDLLLATRKVGPRGRVIGVDMTEAMLERARANVAAAGLDNVDLRQGIIEDLPVADQSVDWVMSNCVINLSPNKPRVFDEIARVLKPGGRMRVADIVAEDIPEWIRQNDDLYDSCVAGAISEADYVAGLRNAGLTDVSAGDRYVYDLEQLDSVASGPRASCTEASRAADALVGRVWSVYFSARKPQQPKEGPGIQDLEGGSP
jgi:arsenite methyltransferase